MKYSLFSNPVFVIPFFVLANSSPAHSRDSRIVSKALWPFPRAQGAPTSCVELGVDDSTRSGWAACWMAGWEFVFACLELIDSSGPLLLAADPWALDLDLVDRFLVTGS